jgi:hypothetical protein
MPDHVQQQTTLVAKIAEKKNPLQPWKDVPCNCVHCGKRFPNNAAKNSHLMHCKFRTLARYYKLKNDKGQTFLFTIMFNPLKRRRNALQKLIMDFHNAEMLLGAIAIWMNEGIVRSHKVMMIEESVGMKNYPDGRVMFGSLKKLLTEKELRGLEAQVTSLNEERDRFRRDAGIVL